MLLITHNGWFYCFCEKYHGRELDYNQGRRLCPLCQMPIYLNNFEGYLNSAQFDLFKLKQFGFKLFPMLMECYSISGCWKLSVDISILLPGTVTQDKKTKLHQIEFTTDLKRRNREKKYFDFFIKCK